MLIFWRFQLGIWQFTQKCFSYFYINSNESRLSRGICRKFLRSVFNENKNLKYFFYTGKISKHARENTQIAAWKTSSDLKFVSLRETEIRVEQKSSLPKNSFPSLTTGFMKILQNSFEIREEVETSETPFSILFHFY